MKNHNVNYQPKTLLIKKWFAFLFALCFTLGVSTMANASSLTGAEYLVPPTIEADFVVNQVQLKWSKNNADDFKNYYVVKSQTDNNPSYPNIKPIKIIDDRNEVSFTDTIKLQDSVEHYYRVCVINTKNNVSCSQIVRVFPNGVIAIYDFFKDVEADSWYEIYVKNLLKKEIIFTGDNAYFYPAKDVTRAELARWVIRAMIERGDFELGAKQSPFCDVLASHPDALYINHAYELGIIEGEPIENKSKCSSGVAFAPSRSVSRAEALKMILLAFDYKPDLDSVSEDDTRYLDTDLFIDVNEGYWAASFIGRGKKEGIVSGYPDDYFRPNQSVNHAEMTKMLSIAFRYELSN